MSDTIAAIATPGQPSAIGILRLSGPDTCAALDAVFRAKNGRPAAQQRPRRLDRAVEVAGVHGVQPRVLKPLRQGVYLQFAPGGYLSVPMPLRAAEEVALRLGVANEVDACHALVIIRFCVVVDHRSPLSYNKLIYLQGHSTIFPRRTQE